MVISLKNHFFRLNFLLYLTLFAAALTLTALTGCPTNREKGSVPLPEELTPMEGNVFNQINEYRVSKDLSPLTVNFRLVEQARIHSRNMGEGKVPFGHQGFAERINATGISFQASAENVAYNMGYKDPVTTVVKGWIHSEGHRRNIEGDFDLTGVGIFKTPEGKYYYTQLFLLTED